MGAEMITSSPINGKIGCSRPAMIRARCLKVRQHNPAQKNSQEKLQIDLNQGHNSDALRRAEQFVYWSFPLLINHLTLNSSSFGDRNNNIFNEAKFKKWPGQTTIEATFFLLAILLLFQSLWLNQNNSKLL